MGDNGWQKIATEQANQLLQEQYPQYLYQSKQFDASFHAVAVDDIEHHHRPEHLLHELLQRQPQDSLQQKLHQLVTILVRYGADRDFLGLTGSMLINQQTIKSDIDLVVYGRDNFHKTRQAVRLALAEGKISMLDNQLMEDNFQRRAGELDFEEFAWHENRKLNKAVIDGSKFDIGMVALDEPQETQTTRYKKCGNKTIITTVIGDESGFDYPACYQLDDAETPEVIVYTHTYVGQAYKGETVEVSGAVECNTTTGKCRLIVGSSREAKGEYIKVYR
jgi:predicted nucleotidyltransferase